MVVLWSSSRVPQMGQKAISPSIGLRQPEHLRRVGGGVRLVEEGETVVEGAGEETSPEGNGISVSHFKHFMVDPAILEAVSKLRVNWAAHCGQVRRTGFPAMNGFSTGGAAGAGKRSGESQTGQGWVLPVIFGMNASETVTSDLQTPQMAERAGMFKSFRQQTSSVLFSPKSRKAEAFYFEGTIAGKNRTIFF
jgi:hypothetical protein